MKPGFSRTQLRFFHLGLSSLPFPGAALVLTARKHMFPTLFSLNLLIPKAPKRILFTSGESRVACRSLIPSLQFFHGTKVKMF